MSVQIINIKENINIILSEPNKKPKDLEKKALKRLKELAKQIHEHNKLYHEKDKPLISDKEFDLLIKESSIFDNKYIILTEEY